jgi:hypothetical protein
VKITVSAPNIVVCSAEKVLNGLYNSFTTATAGTPAIPAIPAKDATAGTPEIPEIPATPGYYLKINGTTPTDQFYINDVASTPNAKVILKQILLKGEKSDINIPPVETAFPVTYDSTKFKGIYGLINAVNILKSEVNKKAGTAATANSDTTGFNMNVDDVTAARLEIVSSFYDKKDSKDTLEEIAYRENQIYREKFLKIILMIVGIFLVGTQLRSKYFSDAGIGGITSLFSGLFSRFGSGFGFRSGSLFGTQFGRSRIGSMFNNSSYSLKTR